MAHSDNLLEELKKVNGIERCIGHDCAMWREQNYYNDNLKAYEKHGFCGLAGAPSISTIFDNK